MVSISIQFFVLAFKSEYARYTDRIAPWVHYVPIQIDLSDLHDALLFFRGDPNRDGSHDYLARKIASAGRQ